MIQILLVYFKDIGMTIMKQVMFVISQHLIKIVLIMEFTKLVVLAMVNIKMLKILKIMFLKLIYSIRDVMIILV